jgi:hypothetical protein
VVFAIHALDVRDILEPGGGDVDDRRTVPLQERVGGDGGADADPFKRTVPGSAPVDGVHDRVDRAGRRGRRLGDDQFPRRIVDPDQIGKRPARIDAEPNGHRCSFPQRQRAQMLSLVRFPASTASLMHVPTSILAFVRFPT